MVFPNFLYDQGTPERSKWVQEAGKIVLAQISEKSVSLQDKKISIRKTQKTRKNTMKMKIGLNGSFCGAF